MRITIGADAIEGPGRVADETRVEAEIAGHPRRGLDAMIGGGTTDHEGGDASGAQSRLEISADEGRVDALDDHGLTVVFARLVLDGIAAALGSERRVRPRAFMADMEDRRAAIAECGEEISDPRHRMRIVAAFAG